MPPSKDEQEAAKNTFACVAAGVESSSWFVESRVPQSPMTAKKFASRADLEAKQISFDRLSDHAYAYTAEGDPNTGIVVGDDSVMVIDAQATRVSVRGALRNIGEVLDGQDGTLIFHFSGHGWADKVGNFYLVPADGSWPAGAEMPAIDTLLSSARLTMWLRAIQAAGGAVPSPFDCWLVLRGIRTLPWRMRNGVKEFHLVAEPVVREWMERHLGPAGRIEDAKSAVVVTADEGLRGLFEKSTAAAAISAASDIRPTPASLDSAISPALGPIIWTPSRRSCSTLRRVAALFHIRGFIAGASRIGRSAASRIALARSSAWPCAIFAIRSAVAGATTIRSHSRARRI